MELTQLRYFLQVYRTGNICGAAAQLNVTQQAVSKQIQKLENELGVELFVRQARGVQATPYAELLASKVQDFLPELDALAYNIQRRDREITGVVRLGIQCWQMGTKQGLRYACWRISGVLILKFISSGRTARLSDVSKVCCSRNWILR